MSTYFGRITGKWMVRIDANNQLVRLTNGRIATFHSQAAAPKPGDAA